MSLTSHTVSVIICAYTEKRWDDLLAAIESVRRQTIRPLEIIVVIDYNPHLLARLQSVKEVTAIGNRQARGLSGSRNSGVAIARGTVVAFLDDDALAEPHWIEQLLALYHDPAVAGVGGKIDPLWSGKRPAWFPDEFAWIVGCTFCGMPPVNAPVRNFIGANMSMRRDVFTAMQGFRESSGWNQANRENNRGKTKERFNLRRVLHYEGGEEAELCIRVANRYHSQLKFFYAPAALVQHRVPRQRARWRYFIWRCFYEGVGKAFLVSLHGRKDGLAAERSYTFRTLPLGLLRGLTDALFHRRLSGLTRSAAIIVGLSATIAGYMGGSISLALKNASFRASYHHPGELLPPVEVEEPGSKEDWKRAIDHA